MKGGQQSGHVKHEKKVSNGTSNNRHELFEDKTRLIKTKTRVHVAQLVRK